MSFTQQITASLDDTHCHSLANMPTDAYAQFGYDIIGKTGYLRDAFLRFYFRTVAGIPDIPVGSTINSAILTLYSYAQRTDDFTSQINFTDEDDAADFSTNPYGRADGGTNVPWDVPDFPAPPNTVQTVDISSLIQTFIDRVGYSENNHIAIRIKRGDAAGNEYHRFYQYDGNVAYAAILTINYTVAVGIVSKRLLVGVGI